jgi:hypothetical protein
MFTRLRFATGISKATQFEKEKGPADFAIR